MMHSDVQALYFILCTYFLLVFSLFVAGWYFYGSASSSTFKPRCSESTFGKMSYLQPMDTRQYLYCLKPKAEYAEKAGVIKGVTVIGKLDIVWKTNLGERGRLQTSQLQRMVHARRRWAKGAICPRLRKLSHWNIPKWANPDFNPDFFKAPLT